MVGTGRFELPNGETSHPTEKDPSAGPRLRLAPLAG